MNSLAFMKWVFIKWEQNCIATSTFLNNDSTYFNVLIQNNSFKRNNTERKERQKTRFWKEILANADLHKLAWNKCVMRKIQFCSSRLQNFLEEMIEFQNLIWDWVSAQMFPDNISKILLGWPSLLLWYLRRTLWGKAIWVLMPALFGADYPS